MHYICTGTCKGTSEHPMQCQNDSCPNYHVDMEECDCTDGNHYGKQVHEHNSDTPETEEAIL